MYCSCTKHLDFAGKLLEDELEHLTSGLLAREEDQLDVQVGANDEAVRERADAHHASEDASRRRWRCRSLWHRRSGGGGGGGGSSSSGLDVFGGATGRHLHVRAGGGCGLGGGGHWNVRLRFRQLHLREVLVGGEFERALAQRHQLEERAELVLARRDRLVLDEHVAVVQRLGQQLGPASRRRAEPERHERRRAPLPLPEPIRTLIALVFPARAHVLELDYGVQEKREA